MAFNLLAGVENYAKAQCSMGTSLFNAGKYQEAMGHYQKALRMKPDLAEAHNMGVALLRLGSVQEAIEHYEHVVRMKPDDVEAQSRLARLRTLTS